MYRILIADDEGIMRESLKNIILQNFEDCCEVMTVKSGRGAIEQAESFHPDIVFMDIQMPGINGIDALKEIRKTNPSILCYILSAYDKFDYAKEAISLGVEKYLMKPINKKSMISAVTEAIDKVELYRRQRSDQLKIQEKLETIIPIVENGFVGSILMQNEGQDTDYYQQLLDVTEEYGYAMIIRYGNDYQDGRLVSSVGMTVKMQEFYREMCSIIKSYFRCCIGSLLSGSLAVIVPVKCAVMDYEERIRVIENTRKMVRNMEERIDARFRVGIGRVKRIKELHASYHEAFQAVNESRSRVIHMDDISFRGIYKEEFPVETEENLYRCTMAGDVQGMTQEANAFFDWMVIHYPDNMNNIRLKVLEFILTAEKEAFHAGAMDYGFDDRRNYLTDIMKLQDYEEIRRWFLDKMTIVCLSIQNKQENQSETVVEKAMNYIQANFGGDISLDDVSKEVNVSPYYFSKLFKKETGENFIEYLTKLRIDRAKEMMKNPELSIKEISMACGYVDPNYFSRIFKKQTDVTPREYREKNSL
ncbi:MAG: response regulator [Blautia sp.]|nr:response regulator [Blautia sp.]MDY5031388.1 response regulator [Blautia sp.]